MKIRRIDFSPDEWIAGCVMLTNAERGLYITACALIYSHGGPVELEHLRRACTDHGHSFKTQLHRLLDLGKLISNGSQIDNKRASNELQNALKRSSNARQNGLKGGRPNGLENPEVFPTRARSHQPSTIKEDTSATQMTAEPSTEADPVKEIFDRGLAILGKSRRSLLGRMRQQHGDEAVLAAIVACEAEQPSEPAAFFVGCMSRAPPRVNGKHPGTYRPGPIAALFEGGHNAAEAYIRKHQGDLSPDPAPPRTLLGRE